MAAHPLIESWPACHATLLGASQRVEDLANQLNLDSNSGLYNTQEGLVDTGHLDNLEASLFTQAAPHVDAHFERWFVLWVARVDGHTLHARRNKTVEDPARGILSLDLRKGDVVILDSHRVHWTTMDPPMPHPGEVGQQGYEEAVRNRFAVAVITETSKRPTREQAEQMLADKVEQGLAVDPPSNAARMRMR